MPGGKGEWINQQSYKGINSPSCMANTMTTDTFSVGVNLS